MEPAIWFGSMWLEHDSWSYQIKSNFNQMSFQPDIIRPNVTFDQIWHWMNCHVINCHSTKSHIQSFSSVKCIKCRIWSTYNQSTVNWSNVVLDPKYPLTKFYVAAVVVIFGSLQRIHIQDPNFLRNPDREKLNPDPTKTFNN